MDRKQSLQGDEPFERLADYQTGNLERPVTSEHLLVFPEVRQIGDLLVFGGLSMRRETPGRGILEEFAKLWNAPDNKILGYAKKWGSLNICKHGRPASHGRGPRCALLEWTDLETWDDGEWWEPIATWRKMARQAHLILTAAARLHEDQKAGISPEDSTLLQEWYFSSVPQHLGVKDQRRSLADIVYIWLLDADVHLRPVWGGRAPDVLLGSFHLYGALGVQLLMAITGKGGFAVCSGCGEAYVPPGRRPARGRARYCPACGLLGRAVQDAKKRYRKRQAEKASRLKRKSRSKRS